MPAPPRLPALDGLRVIAEYFVVRHHILPTYNATFPTEHVNDPIGADIMSLFYVLTGFVTMYRTSHEDLSSWQRKKEFWLSRLYRLYPVFLANWLFQWIGRHVNEAVGASDPDTCVYAYVCPFTQLFMLDSVCGCSIRYLVNGVSWYFSSIFWLWMPFPFFKDRVLQFFATGQVWHKICYVATIWSLIPVLLWGFDLYTVMPFPPVRFGEFLVGCGVAVCVLQDEPYPNVLSGGKFMAPATTWFGLFLLEQTRHNLGFLCLQEKTVTMTCSMWKWGQEWTENSPPCILVTEKLLNKTALVWGVLIYGLTKAELASEDNPLLRVLRSGVLQELSRISVVLYLSHMTVSGALTHVCMWTLGWMQDEWNGDSLLICVYGLCYMLHHTLKAHLPAFKKAQAIEDCQEAEMLMKTLTLAEPEAIVLDADEG